MHCKKQLERDTQEEPACSMVGVRATFYLRGMSFVACKDQ